MTRLGARVDPILFLPAVVIAGLGAAWLERSARVDLMTTVSHVAVAWALGTAATAAMLGPTTAGGGRILAAAAILSLAPALTAATPPILWTLGFVLQTTWAAVLVHAALAYPEAHLSGRTAALVVGSAYAVALLGQAGVGLFLGDPRNLMLVRSEPRVVDALEVIASAVAFAVTLAFVLVVGLRLIRIRTRMRRLAGPVLIGAVLAAQPSLLRYPLRIAGDFASFDALETIDQMSAILVAAGVLVGLGWVASRRGAVSALVIDLRSGGRSFRTRLADALGDPSLELGFLDGTTGKYVDETGSPITLRSDPGRSITRMVSGGAEVARIGHDASVADQELIEAVTATAGLVLENERLAAELAKQLEAARASRSRILAAEDDARRRLERDLHDGAQQRLVGLGLKLRTVEDAGGPAAAAAVAEVRGDVESAIRELREFARGVHPTLLRDDGLDSAVEGLARRSPVPVDVEGGIGSRLPGPIELALYFVVAEALTNVARHAGATRATVRLERRDGAAMVVVSDDGRGSADPRAGSGLQGLIDRVTALDGQLTLDSPGSGGTRLIATIPCAS